MEKLEEEENESLHHIPSDFHSFADGTPFTRCIECDKVLLTSEEDYFIEKAYRKYPGYDAVDIVFEYAICQTCADRMRSQMSEHSLKQIAEFFSKNTKVSRRMLLIQKFPNDPGHWIDECMVSGDSIEGMEEYQIFAHCRGDYLVTDFMPYMLSGKVLDEISQVLSNETLGEFDDFMGRHFGPPPELARDLPYRKVVLI